MKRLELEIYQQTKLSSFLRWILLIVPILLLLSLLIINLIEEILDRYLGPLMIAYAIIFVLFLALKKYNRIGDIVCSETEMQIIFLGKRPEIIEIKDIKHAKLTAIVYRGKSAGLSGLVALGYENTIKLKLEDRRFNFNYYTNDIGEMKRTRFFFQQWEAMNKNIVVPVPII